MLDTILLLTDYLVEQPFLSAWLLENNPCLTVISVLTSDQLGDLDPDILRRARLIAFAASTIVPSSILTLLRFGAYNFHPGPPEYPGWRPAFFALHDRSSGFGVTAHVMVEEVDAGPIVHVDRFDIAPGETFATLEERSYVYLARMFRVLSKALATQPGLLPIIPVAWAKKRRRDSCQPGPTALSA
ncbi:MAG: methionyl-tRNA formyltransferase [Bradyrhizobium sp.]|jgi:methionyl-tRNA formyltransferase|nr:methionyl-tRNA formyltransferase [Bradyrhizobium sp.]